MSRVRARLFGAALSLALVATPASAQPTFWQELREPKVKRAEELMARAELLMMGSQASSLDGSLARSLVRDAVELIELFQKDVAPDPRREYLYGHLLIQQPIARYAEARKVLERALSQDPDSPMAAQGLFDLAIACAKLGDSKAEQLAYTRALTLEWQRDERSVLFLNRAESNMVLGRMDEALSDYSRAISMAGDPRTQALAFYGKGIVKERMGDLPSALRSVELAARIRFGPYSALDLPGVFFVPEFDIHYYKALEAMAIAANARRRTKPSVRGEARALAKAVVSWRLYLGEAEPAKHVWVSHAQRHLRRCVERLEALPRAKPKVPG